jgi:fatty-acyl-CoA synthase
MHSTSETPWIEGLTIGQVLAQTATRHPDRDALVFPGLDFRLSFAELDREATRCAKALLALGIQRGEHVAIWATNVPQWPILQLASARIGAVLVTINPAYRPFELEYVLRQSDAAALFLIDRFKTSDYFAMLAEVCPEISSATSGTIASRHFPKLRHVVAVRGEPPRGAITWESLLARANEVSDADLQARAARLLPRDAINIQYTSGTTGFPKAATLSHRSLLYNAYYVGQCQQFSQQDRVCVPVPFYHCFGCVMGVLCCVVYGAAMIVPAESFDPRATLDAIEREKATAIYGVPTMFIAQLQEPSFAARDLRSLRTGIMAGSPCPIEVMRRVVREMGAKQVTIAYGLTEASPVITQTRTDDPIELRVTTVGRPLPGLEVKVVNPETGQALADNEQGELCTRGHGVMLGYYNDPEATRRMIDAEGWLHTGDLALRQPDGYYRITGRIKDMVIRGGENIYPREIEEFLFTHPAVEQVSVVGVPDPKFGEELCAWIKLRPGKQATAEELRDFCRAKLAHYKVPRYLKFVGEFPQTVTGKIQKFKIREQMIEELGLKPVETA